MGDLAVEYGFYGSMWDPNDPNTYSEVRAAVAQIATALSLSHHCTLDDSNQESLSNVYASVAEQPTLIV